MIDIVAYLSDRGIQFRRANERNISMQCPFCGDDTGRFTVSVNPEKPVFNCWRGRCGRRGDWVGLVMAVGKLFYPEAYDLVYGTISLSAPKPIVKDTERHVAIDLPPSFGWTPKARMYLRRRGVSDSQAKEAGAYYCNVYPYEDRIVFPIALDGIPVSFQARAISDSAPLRYRAPLDSDMGMCLYNYDGIKKGEVILVEGIFDALRLMRDELNVVATFGKKVSEYQVQLLKRKGVSSVCLMYDADAAVAYESIAVKLNSYFNLSYCLLFGGDPAECTNLAPVLDSKCESLDEFYRLQLKRKFGAK